MPTPGEPVTEFEPYVNFVCAGCGGHDVEQRYCRKEHVYGRDRTIADLDVSRMGQTANEAHVHRTCVKCGMTWLVETFEHFLGRKESPSS